MEVIKKDGSIQPLDIEKLKTSIIAACDKPNSMALTESDVNNIVEEVISTAEKIRNDGSYTSSYELSGIVKNTLIKGNYVDLLRCLVAYTPHN